MRAEHDDRYGCIEITQCSGDLALFGHTETCSKYVQLTIRGATWGPLLDGTPSVQQETSDIKIQVAMSPLDFLQMVSRIFANRNWVVPCTIQKFGIMRCEPLPPMEQEELAQHISDWFIGKERKKLASDIKDVEEWIATHKLPKNITAQFRRVLDMRLREVDEIIATAQEMFITACNVEKAEKGE